MKGLRILDEDVIEDEDFGSFTVKSQSSEGVIYTVQTQSLSFWRTTKRKAEFKKAHKLFNTEAERNLLRSSLLDRPKNHLSRQLDDGTRQTGNFSGVASTLESLDQTVFVESPFTVKLYHMKSIDSNLSSDDFVKLKLKDPGFKIGWLYDCIIYSYLVRISKAMHEVKIIDPCISQVIGCPNSDILKNENILDYEKVLIPGNPTGVHWVLLAVHPKDMVIEFYNPASNRLENCYHQFIAHWAKALAKNTKSKVSQWKVCVPKHNCQIDSTSCGVFICWYSEQILSSVSTNASFDTQLFRVQMYDTLMKFGGRTFAKENC
ncbi:unnamed protein product [Bemisia tabaci]|uniref:Ubiquitin-like protease family profile domain-containing protein n=1 Tax=Bemisia tabaci TaxID=7038 RepID=A0A9P0F898_BEMTA|nr:unnamed protein product [Bemisia tabaci]